MRLTIGRWRHKTMGVAALSVALAACASNDIRWTEEVKLSDGRVIQIQRRSELTASGFPVQKRGFVKYHEICYPPMGIHWKSKGGYQPDIFDIVDGKAYMHVPISDCFSCERYDYPSTDALYFVWDDASWKRIAHDEFPIASEWNLLMSIKAAGGHEKDDPHGLVNLQDKERRQVSARIEQKRFGWRRVNESYPGLGRCQACRGVTNRVYGSNKDFLEVFINDQTSSCQ